MHLFGDGKDIHSLALGNILCYGLPYGALGSTLTHIIQRRAEPLGFFACRGLKTEAGDVGKTPKAVFA